jgi:hypothetical protein
VYADTIQIIPKLTKTSQPVMTLCVCNSAIEGKTLGGRDRGKDRGKKRERKREDKELYLFDKYSFN